MDPDNSLPPPRHAPPHIRINSGNNDLLNLQDDSQTRPTASRQPSSRSLTSSNGGGAMPTGLYAAQAPGMQESAEHLLPPSRTRTRRFRDEDSARSPSNSGLNSRRTSWSSESAGSRSSRYGGPFVSPFDDSRAPSIVGSEDEGVNTQTVSEKYNILPSAGLLLFPEDVEKDDYLHNPDPNDRDPMKFTDLFTKRGMANVGGLALITLGLLTLFIGYPIITFVQQKVDSAKVDHSCAANPECLAEDVPLLKGIRTGLIDPDTPENVMTRKDASGKTQKLAFSDEFNDPGRTFYPGDDPYWLGMDFWYGVTMDLEWYDPDAITTANGTLAIQFDAFKNHDLNYRSGMLQSWNMMCFKGGYIEASISLPGRGDTIGFWPGFWAMGNLGRPGYPATTDGMWPYSYHDECDAGITYNQSDPSGLSNLPGMRLPGCTCEGGDHPNPGVARSAPEIDVIEASVEYLLPETQEAAVGSVSQSFQVAPFDVFWQSDADYMEIYDHRITEYNSYQGGVFQQALSSVTLLNNDWYDGKAYQKYGFEYQPGADGYVLWNVGDENTWKVTGEAVRPNGNVGQRVIPEEPLTVVVNFGMSNGFAALNLTGLAPLMPATMRLDYIRIYQDEDGEMTCDPEGYPTTEYIAKYPEAYNDFQVTHWDKAGYEWPKNTFQHECEAASSSKSNKDSKVKRKQKRDFANMKTKRSWMPWG
ncbi:hypothetical protein Q7P37_004067 [Cladosporium fusiforme]